MPTLFSRSPNSAFSRGNANAGQSQNAAATAARSNTASALPRGVPTSIPRGVDAKVAPSEDHLAPYKKTIENMQNKGGWGNHSAGKNLLFTFFTPYRKGTRYIDLHALHTMKFTSISRSRQIIQGLEFGGFANPDGAFLYRDAVPSLVVARLIDGGIYRAKPLSEKEAQGLSLYVQGLMENMHSLGQGSIAALPKAERKNWFFYAGFAKNADESHDMAKNLRKLNVLDHAYIPRQGGKNYDIFRQQKMKGMFASKKHKIPGYEEAFVRRLDDIQEKLFPLPTYTFSPTAGEKTLVTP